LSVEYSEEVPFERAFRPEERVLDDIGREM
jgi:hypothetical protein